MIPKLDGYQTISFIRGCLQSLTVPIAIFTVKCGDEILPQLPRLHNQVDRTGCADGISEHVVDFSIK
jgi:hypothetical protein